MSRVIFILGFVALTFSLATSASPKKEGMTRMMDAVPQKNAAEAMNMFLQTLRECNETFTIEKPYLESLNDSGTFPDETERTPKICSYPRMVAIRQAGGRKPDVKPPWVSRTADECLRYGGRQCYVRCILEKMGVATQEGVYDPELMSSFLAMVRPESNSSGFGEITVLCNNRKETCKCDRAYQYAKCVLQEEMKKNS